MNMTKITREDLDKMAVNLDDYKLPSLLPCAGCAIPVYRPTLWTYGLPVCSKTCHTKVRKEQEKRIEEIERKRDRR